jgi:hypothetical protein
MKGLCLACLGRDAKHTKKTLTCSTTLSLLGRIDHRNLRGQLQVDQKVDATVDLIDRKRLERIRLAQGNLVSEHHVRFPMRPGVLADHDPAVARIRPSIQCRHNRSKCWGVYFSPRRQTYQVNHLSRRARKLPGSDGFACETFGIESQMATQVVQKRDIVVIGGSAGALAPLRTMLAYLPVICPPHFS